MIPEPLNPDEEGGWENPGSANPPGVRWSGRAVLGLNIRGYL